MTFVDTENDREKINTLEEIMRACILSNLKNDVISSKNYPIFELLILAVISLLPRILIKCNSNVTSQTRKFIKNTLIICITKNIFEWNMPQYYISMDYLK